MLYCDRMMGTFQASIKSLWVVIVLVLVFLLTSLLVICYLALYH